MRTSHRAFLLIVTEEDSDQNYYVRHYQHFDWPQGASGPTIGIGYDCGYVTRAQALVDWTGIVSSDTIAAIELACGIQGQAARAFVSAHGRSITITWDEALVEFTQREMPKWEALVDKALPNTNKLSGDSFGAIVSIAYNRGCSFDHPGPRFAEMRAIKGLMEAQEFDRIPAEILSMRRLWPRGGDLWNRRGHEALLFRDGLVLPPAAPAAA
jgi:GH24 family phage-related lysozyme (muramidase)